METDTDENDWEVEEVHWPDVSTTIKFSIEIKLVHASNTITVIF